MDRYVHTTKLWLRHCRDHSACTGNETRKRLPTRVIDVGRADDDCDPFLYESHDELDSWLTLSHRLGTAVPEKLTKSNLDEYRRQITMASLPSLFQDAVTITRMLGFRYLWIDSLCIIQDSKEDWASEAAKMGYIYKHSSLTIAAQASANCHAGVLTSLKDDWQALKDPIALNFLDSRAWTLQESLLSPRTVSWTTTGVIWQCRSAIYHRGFPDEKTPQLVHSFHSRSRNWPRICLPRQSFQREFQLAATNITSQAKDLWYCILHDYVRRGITNHEDRLPAISGVAREIARLTGHRYLAALWMEDIWEGLLWSVSGGAVRSEAALEPSWSWASIEMLHTGSGNAHFHFATRRPRLTEISASILGVNIPSMGSDPFGQVKDARLHLRGPCLYASDIHKWMHDSDFAQNLGSFPWIQLDSGAHIDTLVQNDLMLFRVASCYNDEDLPRILRDVLPATQSYLVGTMLASVAKIQVEDSIEKDAVHYALILEPTKLESREYKRKGLATYTRSMAPEAEWIIESIAII